MLFRSFVEVKKNSLQATELLLEIDDDIHERKGMEIKEHIILSWMIVRELREQGVSKHGWAILF